MITVFSVFCLTGPRDDTQSDQWNWKFILHVCSAWDDEYGWLMLFVMYTNYLAVFRCRIGVVPVVVPLGVGGLDVYNIIIEIKLQK